MGLSHGKKRDKTMKKPTSNLLNGVSVTIDSTRNQPLPPPPPAKPSVKKQMFKALYNYDERESYELTFLVGDILYALEGVEELDKKPWFKAKNSRTEKIGLVPNNYVVIEDGTANSLDCFFDVNRTECERLLQIMGNPVGTYLIRPSTDKPNIALSIRDLAQGQWTVRHFMIRKTGEQWTISHKMNFDTVQHLLDYYMSTKTHLNVRLVQPLPRGERPVVPFKDLEVDRKNFIRLDVLGRGNFGEVWKAKWGENGRMFVAIKVVQPDMMSNEQFLGEAKVMHQLRHERIVELLGISTQPSHEPIYIITEYLIKGALLDFLRGEEGRTLRFPKLIDIMAQVSEGMAYLESKRYIHRDLRAANILVDSNNFVKVADFGLARVMMDDTYSANNLKFPVRWTAPEASKMNQFSIKSDVWSFGILGYEIITYGGIPYEGMNTRDARRAVEEEDYRLPNPDGQMKQNMLVQCPEHLYTMMTHCWNERPEDRPTFEYLNDVLNTWAVSSETQYEQQE